MKKSDLLQLCVVLALVFIAGTMLRSAESHPSTANWQTTLQQRLPLYGHRNWIVVSLSSSRGALKAEQLLQNQFTQSPSLHYIGG